MKQLASGTSERTLGIIHPVALSTEQATVSCRVPFFTISLLVLSVCSHEISVAPPDASRAPRLLPEAQTRELECSSHVKPSLCIRVRHAGGVFSRGAQSS